MAFKDINNEILVLVPFNYEMDGADQSDVLNVLHERALGTGAWKDMNDEIKHMHRFISNRLTSTDSSERRCEHYVRTFDEGELECEVVPVHERPQQDEGQGAIVYLRDIHLYAFLTGIGIAALRVAVEDRGIEHFSQVHDMLKRLDETNLKRRSDSSCSTVFEIVEDAVHDILTPFTVDYFFYQFDDSHRANSVVFYETKHEFDEDEELWMLCSFHNHYEYNPSSDDESEKQRMSPDIVWRASTESAACLVDPSYGRAEVLRDYKGGHFSIEESFLYVLVMHQKYALFRLMELIDADSLGSPERLQSFSEMLFRIETNYVFTQVSEVPHYQLLYTLFVDSASVKELIADIKGPITSLERIRTEENKAREERSRKTLNLSLAILALFGMISMLGDGCGLIGTIFNGVESSFAFDIPAETNSAILLALQIAFIVTVILLLRRTISRILRLLNDK